MNELERLYCYANSGIKHPFFVKKANEAKEKIKKVGLPKTTEKKS
jgi:hypothetical protein